MQTQRLVGQVKGEPGGSSILDARQETRRVNDASEAIATGDLRATIPACQDAAQDDLDCRFRARRNTLQSEKSSAGESLAKEVWRGGRDTVPYRIRIRYGGMRPIRHGRVPMTAWQPGSSGVFVCLTSPGFTLPSLYIVLQ